MPDYEKTLVTIECEFESLRILDGTLSLKLWSSCLDSLLGTNPTKFYYNISKSTNKIEMEIWVS